MKESKICNPIALLLSCSMLLFRRSRVLAFQLPTSIQRIAVPSAATSSWRKQQQQHHRSIQNGGEYSRLTFSSLHVHRTWDADTAERFVGGVRYENVPMPKSMKSTTVFVGNLCEFVKDDDLSHLFQSVSKLHSVPACVARKPDTTSLRYGFVTFPNEEEKEQAIIRFHNYEWRGKRLKVEEIKDSIKAGSEVLIPGKLVAYVTGFKRLDIERKKVKSATTKSAVNRISRDDVDRLSRGEAAKQRGYGSRSVPHRLNEAERAEFDRATRKGYLTLIGGGNRRTRKGSPLANIHRQWCDARAKPQILLFKANRGATSDQVVVDLSPLRLNGMFDDPSKVEEFMVKWRTQAITAAVETGMDIRADTDEQDEDDNDVDVEDSFEYVITIANTNQEVWATKPIWQLPVVSLGVFEGDRNKAKAMAKTLGDLWDIPEESQVSGDRGKRDNRIRKRGGGHRQAW